MWYLAELDECYITGPSRALSTFNCIINGYAKEGKPRDCERILKYMIDIYSNQLNYEARANTITYNTTLSTWAKEGEANCIEQILRTIEQLHSSASYPEIRPEVMSYSALLDAYYRCPYMQP